MAHMTIYRSCSSGILQTVADVNVPRAAWTTILTYIVPAGQTLRLIGWFCSTEETSAQARLYVNTVKRDSGSITYNSGDIYRPTWLGAPVDVAAGLQVTIDCYHAQGGGLGNKKLNALFSGGLIGYLI